MKAPEICNFSKKELQYKCLPENSAKFLRITFLQNTFEWLLLDFFFHLTTKLISAILWTNRNHVFYIFERFIMAFERDEYHDLCIWKNLLCKTNHP